jgi:hypothetical protein
MNDQGNLEEMSPQSSVVTNDETRVNIENLFDQIKDMLDLSFDAFSLDEARILNLKELMEQVSVFKDSFNDVEVGFYLAIKFYLYSFGPNMRKINNDLAALRLCEHQYGVSQRELNFLNKQREINSEKILKHILSQSYHEDLLKKLGKRLRTLQDMVATGQHVEDDEINNIEEKIRVANVKLGLIPRMKESTYKTLNEVIAKIMGGHNERSEIESNMNKAFETYEAALSIKNELIEGWTDLQAFVWM